MTPKGSTPVSPTRLRTTDLETNHVEPRALGQAPKPGHWLVCSEMSIQGGNPKVCTPTTQEDDLVLSAGNTLIKLISKGIEGKLVDKSKHGGRSACGMFSKFFSHSS